MRASPFFISGLPRSGSTLLAAVLRQNPALHAAMSSPVAPLMETLWAAMGAGSEAALLVDDAQRRAMLRAVFDAYYADVAPDRVVFDTNRTWCARMEMLVALFPDAKVICCVREVAWVLDSFERIARENPFTLSRLYSRDQASSVYGRTDALANGAGVVGFALNALREAFYGPHADRLLLVDYEALAREPAAAIAFLYDRLGLPAFAHDFAALDYDAAAFDRSLGAPGLHTVARQVRFSPRKTLLPPDLFRRFETDDFWRDPVRNQGAAAILLPADLAG